MSKLNILKCRDTYDGFKINKGEMLPSLPTKIAILGKSALSGKTTLLSNLINRDEFFGNDFKGDNIYLISSSTTSDDKLINTIKYKEIPEQNIYTELNDDVLASIMEAIKEKYTDFIRDEKRPEHSLVVFDDISYSSALSKRVGADKLSELFCNYRHYLTSIIVTAQKSTQLARVIRVNTIMFLIFKQSLLELENVMGDVCYINKKLFKQLFQDATKGKHDFLVVNLDAKPEHIYCACGEETNNEIKPILFTNQL